MEHKEVLAIIGDLYLKNYALAMEKEKVDKENEELKKMILVLNNKNGTISS
jgi:hypothetical protein